ncbi:MAG: hypothetical protein WBO34_08835 [Gammaproteobacteria bacterium]
MRYRIGETPNELGEPVGHGVLVGGAILSFVIGIGFIFAGLRSRHYWLTIWGSGLSLSSAAYLLYVSLLP